jgi:hypothetical protein
LPMIPPTTACGGASPPRRGQEPSRTSFAPEPLCFSSQPRRGTTAFPLAGKVAFRPRGEMTNGGMLCRCFPPPPPAAEPPHQGEAKNRAELPSLRSRFVFHHSRGAAAFPPRGEGGNEPEWAKLTDEGKSFACKAPISHRCHPAPLTRE